MAPKENAGETQNRAVGNLATAHHEDRTYPLSVAVGQRTNEERCWSQFTSVISMGVIDEKSFSRECITWCLQALDVRLAIVSYATCDDCLQNMESPHLVIYHVHEDMSQWDTDSQKLLSFKKLLNIVPVIILSDIDSPDYLLEIFESGARGFVPTDNTTLEQVIEIIGLVKAGGIFVPPSSLFLQRTKRQSVTARPASSNQFTSSERAILDRLKVGKPNKIIAHELGVSESTVKVHIGRIMKKLKVTNRTQVVSRAYALAAVAARSTGEV